MNLFQTYYQEKCNRCLRATKCYPGDNLELALTLDFIKSSMANSRPNRDMAFFLLEQIVLCSSAHYFAEAIV